MSGLVKKDYQKIPKVALVAYYDKYSDDNGKYCIYDLYSNEDSSEPDITVYKYINGDVFVRDFYNPDISEWFVNTGTPKITNAEILEFISSILNS